MALFKGFPEENDLLDLEVLPDLHAPASNSFLNVHDSYLSSSLKNVLLKGYSYTFVTNPTVDTGQMLKIFRAQSNRIERHDNVGDYFRAFRAHLGIALQNFPPPCTANLRHVKELTKEATQTNLVIKKADKSTQLTVLDKTSYVESVVEQHLNNHLKYELVMNSNDESTFLTHFTALIQRANSLGLVTDTEYRDVRSIHSKSKAMYCLPKTHKKMEKWDARGIPPLRPIVASPNYFTKPIEKWVSRVLSPLVAEIPHVLKNTKDCTNRLQNLHSKFNYVTTADITDLYGSLPHDLVVQSAKFYFRSNSTDHLTDTFGQIVSSLITNNFFMFADKMYRQKTGIAMGLSCGPELANLAMGYLERSFRPGNYVMLRYLDDTLWLFKELSDFEEIKTVALSLHPSIKYEFETPNTHADFLDITVAVTVDKIIYQPYTKPSATHEYTLATSNTSPNTKKGIFMGEVIRFYRNSSSFVLFERAMYHLLDWFLRRGYCKRTLRAWLRRTATKLKQTKQLQPEQPRLFLPIVFGPNTRTFPVLLNDIHNKVINECSDYETSNFVKTCMYNCPVTVCWKSDLKTKNVVIRSVLC